MSDTLMQCRGVHSHSHTVIEGVTQVKPNALHQVLRLVDENKWVAMEMKVEADMLSQLSFLPLL